MGKVLGGNRLQCPYHGLEFDRSGACVRNPHGDKRIPSRAKVKSYPAIEKHKAIWVWMGDQPADREQGAGLQRDGQRAGAAHHQARQDHDPGQRRADHRQSARPLHTSFLHDGILGNADTVESEIVVKQDGNNVTVERHARDAEPPGMNKLMWPTSPPRLRQDHQHHAGWRPRR